MTPAQTGQSLRGHVPALDGLRAISFGLVFAHHALPEAAPWVGRLTQSGWCGVDVFFALSGFLVTHLLLAEERRSAASGGTGRFSLLRFWIRRALRIWPLYFAALSVGFLVAPRIPGAGVIAPAIGSPAYDSLVSSHAFPACIFGLNWSVIVHGWPDFTFGTLWSVSVEEQFYVLWPALLALVPARHRLRAAIVLAVAAAIARTWTIFGAGPYVTWYVSTALRADALMAGAALALLIDRNGGVVQRPPRWLPLFVTGCYLLNVAVGRLGGTDAWREALRYPIIDAMAFSAVWIALSPGRVADVLAWAPLQWAGRLSYGLYVWHLASIAVCGELVGDLRDSGHNAMFHVVRATCGAGLTLLAAYVSYRLIELPFLRLKARFA